MTRNLKLTVKTAFLLGSFVGFAFATGIAVGVVMTFFRVLAG